MKGLIAFVTGLIFAIGLGVSGMTRPDVVKGFLDITGNWDWSLLGVMAGAISVHAVAYYFIRKREAPVLDSQFHVPTKKHLDHRLLLGAAIFGLGWGWAGICPGPGIVSLASGKVEFAVFVFTMLAGMKIFELVERRIYGN